MVMDEKTAVGKLTEPAELGLWSLAFGGTNGHCRAWNCCSWITAVGWLERLKTLGLRVSGMHDAVAGIGRPRVTSKCHAF